MPFSSSNTRLESGFSDPHLCRALLGQLKREIDAPFRFMEVCGTHTVSLFRSGLRSLLPEELIHLSGPGCPVCVTHEREVEVFLDLSQKEGVILATFGDVMRIPGASGTTLKIAKAQGALIEVVYSPLDALVLAQKNPQQCVVFLGIGFETTAPTVAATVKKAKTENIQNFFVLSLHKLVPPVLEFLLAEDRAEKKASIAIDAFLLPGHVSTIIGTSPYSFLAEKYQKIGVIGGFEPADILEALLRMVRMRKERKNAIFNAYSRAVAEKGNEKALTIMNEVFTAGASLWRGFGLIDNGGLVFTPEYAQYDAMQHFALTLPEVTPRKGCKCGEILRGRLSPDKCPLFNIACTPATPIGPCMVSSEGSCAAYQKYGSCGVVS